MKQPLISVIIPCYNVEKFIDRCLESVVNQTYNNLEIILVNDGSTDSTPLLCDSWEKRDGRISVIHKENDGLANARNSGIDAATGDYFLFVDSDDYIDRDMVDFLLNLSLQYNADVSRCGYYYDIGNNVTPKSSGNGVYQPTGDALFIDLISNSYIAGVAWNKLYKSELVKNHPYFKEDGSSEDILHNFRLYRDVKRVAFCDEPKYHYCYDENSITNSKFNYGAFDIVRARHIMLDSFRNNPYVYPYALEWLLRSDTIVLSGCIKSGECVDRYDELRDELLSHLSFIMKNKNFGWNHKCRTVLLQLSPSIYNLLVKMKG